MEYEWCVFHLLDKHLLSPFGVCLVRKVNSPESPTLLGGSGEGGKRMFAMRGEKGHSQGVFGWAVQEPADGKEEIVVDFRAFRCVLSFATLKRAGVYMLSYLCSLAGCPGADGLASVLEDLFPHLQNGNQDTPRGLALSSLPSSKEVLKAVQSLLVVSPAIL